MDLKRALAALARVIAEEAERNPDFRNRVEIALGLEPRVRKTATEVPQIMRKGGRRTPAVLDPIEMVRQGEGTLRAQLATLDLEKLRDIVAQYGMDPGKLVMKWKDPARIADRIVEVALARATKGDAFRGS